MVLVGQVITPWCHLRTTCHIGRYDDRQGGAGGPAPGVG